MKIRLDQLLVERGLAETRSVAQAIIMAGKVRSGEVVLAKPGQQVAADIELVVDTGPQYVSRGGDKLASVADKLGLDFDGKTVLDVGSSTGGFTDYALQHRAAKVYAVDVGNAQLAYKLRQDPRVTVMERTDIRDVAELSIQPDIAVIDVSFISLAKVLPRVADLLQPAGQIVVMAKPQFETDKATADKFKGVISDENVRQQILSDFEDHIKADFEIIGSADSAVAGTQGNRERFYLLLPRSARASSLRKRGSDDV